MTRRRGTGRIKRAAVWLVVGVVLGFLFSPIVLADSKSTTAAVDFTPGSPIGPVSPINPERPGNGSVAGDWEQGGSPGYPGQEQATTRPEAIIHDDEAVPVDDAPPVRRIPGETGASGWLAINYMTPLHYNREVADGIFTIQQEHPYIQTSDLRGTASGWKVTAIAGPFQDPGDRSPVPALLSFSDGCANSASIYLEPPEIPGRIELPADGSTQWLIEIAEENKGVGIWVVRWYPQHGVAQDFQLRLFTPVSKGALGGMLWVMNDAP